MSLSGFDEISEAVLEAGRNLTEKAEQERKRLQNVYIFAGLTAGSQNVKERVCFLSKSQWREWVDSVGQNGENERECAISISEKCKRVSAWKTRVYIGNPCHAVGSMQSGQNQSCGRRWEH